MKKEKTYIEGKEVWIDRELIQVIGVGKTGLYEIRNMLDLGLDGVEFVGIDTDELAISIDEGTATISLIYSSIRLNK